MQARFLLCSVLFCGTICLIFFPQPPPCIFLISFILAKSQIQENSTDDSKDTYFCLISVASKDNHHVVSPADVLWDQAVSIKGTLQNDCAYFLSLTGHSYPTSEYYLRRLPHILTNNERVAVSGQWEHGQFSVAYVCPLYPLIFLLSLLATLLSPT